MSEVSFTVKGLEVLLSQAKLEEMRAVEKQRAISICLSELVENQSAVLDSTAGINTSII